MDGDIFLLLVCFVSFNKIFFSRAFVLRAKFARHKVRTLRSKPTDTIYLSIVGSESKKKKVIGLSITIEKL